MQNVPGEPYRGVASDQPLSDLAFALEEENIKIQNHRPTPALLFQQRGPQPLPGQQARGHQPRSAAADDCNAHVPHS